MPSLRRPACLLVGLVFLSAAAQARAPLVLLTDFGTQDGAVSAMKGVAYGVSQDLLISDLSHENPSIFAGAYRLYQAEQFWPVDTVFVAVVDPGVGTQRLSIALKTRTGHYFVGPNNGLLSLVAERDGIEALRRIDERVNRLPGSEESHTFHGRDVFAYTGARLAAGVISFEQVGPALSPQALISIPYRKPRRTGDTVSGIIPVLDVQFGNVWTNIPKSLFDQLHVALGAPLHVRIYHGDQLVDDSQAPYQRTFGDVAVGKPLVYINSLLNLALALNLKSYAATHQIDSGPDWTIEIGAAPEDEVMHDLVLRNGTVYDGSGKSPYAGEVAIDADRITYVGPPRKLAARTEIDVKGQAIAPGFINMLAHPEESLFADGRALSDLQQGVTLEVMGEFSMGPLNQKMAQLALQRQDDIKYAVTWSTLGGYLETLERRGISPNVASLVGAPTVRTFVLGEADVQPTPAQLEQMRALVQRAMEEGALGLTTALIYAPASYAKTPELIALARESARCGGIYTVHMRSEGDRIETALQETIDIAQASGAPAEIYHLKVAGKDNWGKLDRVIATIDKARAAGVRISADMYTYTAGATGLDAAMPLWVQDGGLEAWIARLKDPAVRTRVIAEMRDPHPAAWENLLGAAGADGTLLLAFKNPKLKPLTGKSLAEVAKMRGVSPQDAAIDLVIEDGSRVGIAYFLMNEDNVRRQVALPWISFGSDESGDAPEGVFLLSAAHPRAYGNFARVFAQYVRKDHALSIEEAVRKLTSLPADNLSLPDRGRLKGGAFADIVVFDPGTIQDHATYAKPHQLSSGVSYVIVNGKMAIKDGKPTGAATGRVVRGRAWTGAAAQGGCRSAAKDWTWSK
jgi:N-acyl-D-amino-acid deacylase